MIKQRLFGFLITLISIGILYKTHYDAVHSGEYYLKAAGFAPLGIGGGIFLVFFPQFWGKPETTREKAIVLTVFAVGILLGLYNRYLIDPRMFQF